MVIIGDGKYALYQHALIKLLPNLLASEFDRRCSIHIIVAGNAISRRKSRPSEVIDNVGMSYPKHSVT
jgi:hypothetical protein